MARILIADDNDHGREMLSQILKHFGHDLREAIDGVQALEQARVFQPDLIITDLLMPKMDGYQLALNIRREPGFSKTPIIFYSATYHESEARALAKSCGGVSVLMKPSEPKAILETVTSVLDLDPKDAAAAARDFQVPAGPDQGLLSDILSKTVMERKGLSVKLAALVQLGMEMASEHEPANLLLKFCRAAREVLTSQSASIGIVEDGEENLAHFILDGVDVEGDARRSPKVPRETSMQRLLNARRSFRLDGAGRRAEDFGLPSEHGAISCLLGVPIATGLRIYGWLLLSNKLGQEEFTEEDERLAVTLAAQIAIAYENAQIHAEVRRQTSELERKIAENIKAQMALEERSRLSSLQSAVVIALIQGTNLRLVLDHCAEALVDHLDAALARIWIFNEQDQVLEMEASAGLYTHITGLHSRVPLGKFKIGQIAEERRPQFTNSVAGDPRIHDQEWVRREGLVAFAGYPLIVEDRLLGVMAIFSRQVFSDAALNALASLASGIALGIERKRTERQLLQAKDAAEAANRAKSEFLAVISHELRTPLNGIFAMTSFLSDINIDEEQRELVEIARRSADLLLGLINNLLDFSRIEVGKVSLESTEFDLLKTIEEVVDLLADELRLKELEVILKYPASMPRRLVGDAGRLRQVLINLLNNAIKFTPRGHVQIEVQCINRMDRSAKIQLTVEDTGIGIPDDKLDFIFGKFTQVDSSNTRKYGGMGLGLAICKELVMLMNGDIGVNSRMGAGSSFWVSLTLPLGEEVAAADARWAGLADRKVLIASKNPSLCQALSEQLQGWGMLPACSASLEESLTAIECARVGGKGFSLVLLDLPTKSSEIKPFKDFVQEKIRRSGAIPVFLSWNAPRRAGAYGIKAGDEIFLAKPIHLSRLREDLLKICNAGLEAAPQEVAPPPEAGEAAELAASKNAAGKPKARILVVEDNLMNQKVAVLLLEKLGYRVDAAANGKEALQLLDIFPYDLLFLDCNMPVMDGFEAAGAIRRSASARIRILPIIAMTASAAPGDKDRCLNSGMDDYIAKPVSLESLKNVLARWTT